MVVQLESAFHDLSAHEGLRKANLWLFSEIIRSMPGLFTAAIYWRLSMFKNDIKSALRNVKKDRGVSVLNLLGLTIGIAAVLSILLFVQHELRYDNHHENADRIYRLNFYGVLNGNSQHTARACPPLAQLLVDEYPGVEAITKMRHYSSPVFRVESKIFSEERVFWVDPAFFDVFTVPFISGNPKNALLQPNQIVLTRSMAKKYFGDTDPVGRIIDADGQRDYIVSAVVEDVPPTSHFHFDFLCSLTEQRDANAPVWFLNDFYIYVLLDEGTNVLEMEADLAKTVGIHLDKFIKGAIGISFDEFIQSGGAFQYSMQPLLDIHLNSHLEFELEANGNVVYVYLFAAIAIAILLISCINFINLSTARSVNRAREIAVRKCVGSSRGLLIKQFLTETILLSLVAVIVASIIVKLTLPLINQIVQRDLIWQPLSVSFWLPGLLLFAILLGVVAGIYPALVLSSFKPAVIMQGRNPSGGRGQSLRRGMVIFQFFISIMLIIGALTIRKQVDFIQNSNLGFSKEQIVIIKRINDLGGQAETFKQTLLTDSNIQNAARSDMIMGDIFEAFAARAVPSEDEQTKLIWYLNVDEDFIDTYEIKLSDGRSFSSGQGQDRNSILINETAASVLGYEDAVGRHLINSFFEDNQFTIIGVIKDFHFESMHQPIRSLILLPIQQGGTGDFLSVRLSTMDIAGTLKNIEKTWKEFAPGHPFEFEFFNQHYSKIYEAEERTAQIFYSLSILAVCIANLGLFGLSTYMVERRIKEIGIRKTMGASFLSILYMLLQQFLVWIAIASVIACPVAYWGMEKWLRNFAYRCNLDSMLFITAIGIALIVAVLTVLNHALKAARSNPVKCLRYE